MEHEKKRLVIKRLLLKFRDIIFHQFVFQAKGFLSALLLCLVALTLAMAGEIPSYLPTPNSSSATLNVVLDDNYPPYIFRSSAGELEGYEVDYWALWEKKTGVHVNLIGDNWARAQEIMRSGKADVIDTIFFTKERSQSLDFAPPYTEIPVQVYVQNDLGGVASLKDLYGFRVAAKEGDSCVARLRAAGIVDIVLYRNYEELVEAAQGGFISIFCMDAPPADYFLYKAHIHKNFRKAILLYTGEFHRAVKKGATATLELIQSGDRKISVQEKKSLSDKWLVPENRWEIPFKWMGWMLLAVLAGSSLIAAWVWMLRREVFQRTEELDKERSRLRALVETIPDLVWLRDLNGAYLVCNPVAQKYFSVPESEIIGKTDYDLFPVNLANAYRSTDLEVVKIGKPITFEEELIHPISHQKIIVEITKAPMRDSQGQMIGILGVARDVTNQRKEREEQTQLQAKVQQAQKLESLGVLAGGIAHDFNNLLTSILGNADLAMEQLPFSSEAHENIQEIETASRRAAELCRQLLAYSGKGRFQVRPLDLQQVVEEMTHLLFVSISKNAILKYNFASNLPSIEADTSQVRQVVMNLITNASEAIGGRSGVIRISTGVVECDEAYLRTTFTGNDLKPGLYVSLEVSDTGCGMEEATLKKIFDPFFTTKFTGRGLGLAAILGIMRSHQGAIKVYSELGKGSTFKVLFPAGESLALHPEPWHPVAVWSGHGKVLLVDDEKTIRDVGRQILQRAGLTVLTAVDGQDALEVFRKEQDIQCVILDLTMPRMDGETCFRELRRLKPSVKVLISSGYNEQDVICQFGEKGIAGFVQKPYMASELLLKIKEALEVSNQSDSRAE